MTDRIVWTSREWQAIVAVLPSDKIGPKGPTPAQLDAAQRAALPPDRWRPRTSMSGRLNRAHTTGQLMAALLRSAQAAAALSDRLRALQSTLASVSADIEQLRFKNPLLRATYTPINVGTPPCELQQAQQAAKSRLNRVDVVGMIAHQITRVRDALPPEVAAVVRFIDVGVSNSVRDPASRAVLVTGYISHRMQSSYNRSRYVFVPKPTAARVVPEVLALAYEHTDEATTPQ